MKVEVQLFARARDLAGASPITVEVGPGATVADLRAALVLQQPALRPLAKSLLVAVGGNYASDSEALAAASEVACFPPVSGG